jgi:hypothetical protein
MKRSQIVVLAFLAVFALSAVIVSSASAEVTLLAEWLLGGEKVVTLLAMSLTGTYLFEDTNNKGAVTCEATWDGSAGPNGEGEITQILTKGGVAASLTVPITACTADTGSSCAKEPDIELSPVGLPWHTNLSLMENGAFLFESRGSGPGGLGGWEIVCLVAGIKVTDTCEEASDSILVENVTEGTEEVGAETPSANCSLGGTGTGLVEAVSGDVWLIEGGHVLDIASE